MCSYHVKGARMAPGLWQHQSTRAAGIFFLIWVACVAFLAVGGGNFLFPISSLVLFGIVLTGAALLLTRKTDAPPVPVCRPKAESLVILAYLLVYALVLFDPTSGIVRNAFTPGPVQECVVLAYKILVHLVVPALLIRAVHGHLHGSKRSGRRPRVARVGAVL